MYYFDLLIVFTFLFAAIYFLIFLLGFARETLDNNLFDVNIFSQKYLGEEGRLDGQTSRKAVQAMASVSAINLSFLRAVCITVPHICNF